MKNGAFSIFGTVDFDGTDRLTLTLGGNYTKDRKRFSTNVVSSDVFSGVNLDAAAYTPFRQALLVGQGVDPVTAAFLAANPTMTLPDGRSANPLAGLKAFQFLPPFLNVPHEVESGKTNAGAFSYRVRAAYALHDTVNTYANYATEPESAQVGKSEG